jgi:hypothetical protein
MNGRWAMMAVSGILATDLIGKGDWWTIGAEPTALPFPTLVAIEVRAPAQSNPCETSTARLAAAVSTQRTHATGLWLARNTACSSWRHTCRLNPERRACGCSHRPSATLF